MLLKRAKSEVCVGISDPRFLSDCHSVIIIGNRDVNRIEKSKQARNGFVSCNRSGRWISVNITVLIFVWQQYLHISEIFEYAESVLCAAAVRNAHRSAVLRHIHFAVRSVCAKSNTAGTV